MNNIFKAFNVNNDTELNNLIESLDLDYNQTTELYTSLNESMSIDGIRYIINDLTKKFDNGSYEKLQEQLGKDNQRRKKEEISNKDPQLESDIVRIENIVNNTTNVDILKGLLNSIEQKIPMASDIEQMNKLGEIKEKINTKINISTKRVRVAENQDNDISIDKINTKIKIYDFIKKYPDNDKFMEEINKQAEGNNFQIFTNNLFKEILFDIIDNTNYFQADGYVNHPFESYKEEIEDKIDEIARNYFSEDFVVEFTRYDTIDEFLLNTKIEDIFGLLSSDKRIKILLMMYNTVKEIYKKYIVDILYKKPKTSGEEFDESVNVITESEYPEDMSRNEVVVDITNIDYDNDADYEDNNTDYDEEERYINSLPKEFKNVKIELIYNTKDAKEETDGFLSDLQTMMDQYITDKSEHTFGGYNYNIVHNGFKDKEITAKDMKDIPTGEEFMESYNINEEPMFDIGNTVTFVWKDKKIVGRVIDKKEIGGNDYYNVISYNTKMGRMETYTNVDPVSNQMERILEEN